MSAPVESRLLPSLLRREHRFSADAQQLQALERLRLPLFAAAAASAGHEPLRAASLATLQVNLGKRCNQTCRHCHVDAGPDRREVMSDAVLEACIEFLARHRVPTLDITGGAPELHPRFRELVERARALGCRVIDRCNLTITRLPNYADLPQFFAQHRVEVVASLPWYRAQQTDAQRGDGVFEQSIQALRSLNAVGYGAAESSLHLTLVTNPTGAYLPPEQDALERDWKREMQRLHGVVFNRLFTITNMPISRYLEYLESSDLLEAYMQRLVQAFNPQAVAGVMCRTTLSVAYDGRLYDCDFNQMLGMELPTTILHPDFDALAGRVVRTAQHCFGCTAGSGSSCGGATI